VLLEQLSRQPPGRMPVALALNQCIEHRAMLVYCSPQPVLLAFDSNHHFVDVPLVTSGQRGTSDAPTDTQAEFYRPASHFLLRQFNAARRQQIPNHAQAQRKTVLQPRRITDYIGRKPVACIGDGVVRICVVLESSSFHTRNCRCISGKMPK
jgi:hypothetical protein